MSDFFTVNTTRVERKYAFTLEIIMACLKSGLKYETDASGCEKIFIHSFWEV